MKAVQIEKKESVEGKGKANNVSECLRIRKNVWRHFQHIISFIYMYSMQKRENNVYFME